MPEQPTTSMPTRDAGEASNLPDAYKELLEEYSLGDSQVLQRALAGLNLESPLEERALRTYLDNMSEEDTEAPVIEKIEGREALKVSATLVQREIQETAAHVEYQKAQDTLQRAQQERKIASDHMMKVLRRSGKLPAEKECGIDAARGKIYALPFDGKPVLLELALHLLKMDDASLSLIEEHEGELFPEPMQEKLSRIERDAPDLKAREFLTDLASLELNEAGRRIVISMVKRPDAAGGLAETEDLPDSLGFLVHLCLHAAAK